MEHYFSDIYSIITKAREEQELKASTAPIVEEMDEGWDQKDYTDYDIGYKEDDQAELSARSTLARSGIDDWYEAAYFAR